MTVFSARPPGGSVSEEGGTREIFDDAHALWEAVCEHELEGVVAKRRSGRYMPGRSGWIKTKNRDYWSYEMERESVQRQAPAAVCLTGKPGAQPAITGFPSPRSVR